MKNVVDTDWLVAHFDEPDLIVLDASYSAVGGQRPAHEGVRIKGARKFEIDYFSDQENVLPHMLAPGAEFEKKAQKLGINGGSRLVIYDSLGIYSSPRAWWMFKVMGHDNVAVLDGGLPNWVLEGRSVEEVSEATYPQGDFKATLRPEMVKSMPEVRENIQAKTFQLIDARSKGRFDGTAPEPRPGLSSGHVENAINIPFQDVLENGCFKPVDELKPLFEEVARDMPMTFSCGSGLTACIVMIAAELVAENEKAVYDGSWTEWASAKSNPILRN